MNATKEGNMQHFGTKTFESPRLIYRQFMLDDYEDMFRNWAADPDVQLEYGEPVYTSITQTRDLLRKYTEDVIEGASFSFKKGLIYGILGRNGAGKTTLFNCISGNLDMDGGDISLEEDGKKRTLKYHDIGMVSALQEV